MFIKEDVTFIFLFTECMDLCVECASADECDSCQNGTYKLPDGSCSCKNVARLLESKPRI